MMHLFMKKRGSVSIFLVIILVPMITVTSLFVDAARIKLAQSVASSAGDLALNTVLTQYDSKLKDYYGLMASCENIDEFLGVMEDYYRASLVSQGMSTTDADQIAGEIAGILNGESEIADFLRIEMEEGDFSMGAAPNGTFQNPALVKKQIVEFMKYRSPINAAAALFDALKGVQKETEALPHESDLVEKKQKFGKAEQKLMEKVYEAYNKLKDYEGLNITKAMVDEMKGKMANYESQYKQVHKKMVYDLCNTAGHGQFQGQTIQKNPTLSNPFKAERKASAGNIKNYVDNTIVAMDGYVEAKKKLESASNAISYGGDTYDTQYWIHMEEVLSQGDIYNNYVRKANSLCKNFAILKNAVEFCEDEALSTEYTHHRYENVDVTKRNIDPTTGKPDMTLQDWWEGLDTQYSSIKRYDFDSNDSTFNELTNRLVSISSNALSGSSINLDGKISPDEADRTIKGIYGELNGYYTAVEAAEKEVTEAVGDLKKARDLIEPYRETFQAWKDKVENFPVEGNELQKLDKEEIEQLDKDVLENVTEENIDELVKRLNDIKSLLGSIKKGIDEYKYNGTPIRKIDSYNKMKNKSGVKEDQISTLRSELESYANSTFRFENATSIHSITDNNNPSLEVKKPKFYGWMQEKFKETGEMEKGKNKYDEYEDWAEKEAEGEDEAQLGKDGKEISQAANLLSSGGGEEVKKEGGIEAVNKFIGNLFGDFGGTLKQLGVNLRDSLYVTDYITSMFSYDTYDKELAFDLAQDDAGEGETAEQKSLTNKPIDDANCYSYGNEVEYILYGKTNAQNKASAYGTIFMMRYGFNIAPVFKLYMDIKELEGKGVSAVADAISAATSGIVPAILVRVAICLGIVAAESAVDLSHIKAGKGIKLLKTKTEELFVKFTETGDEMSGELSKDGNQTGHPAIGTKLPKYFQYSDYLTLFLLLQLNNSSKANMVYLRTADVIQCNMQKVTDNSEFYLKDRPTYYTIDANIRVKPVMLGLPINSGIDTSWLDTSTWNTFRYKELRGY